MGERRPTPDSPFLGADAEKELGANDLFTLFDASVDKPLDMVGRDVVVAFCLGVFVGVGSGADIGRNAGNAEGVLVVIVEQSIQVINIMLIKPVKGNSVNQQVNQRDRYSVSTYSKKSCYLDFKKDKNKVLRITKSLSRLFESLLNTSQV